MKKILLLAFLLSTNLFAADYKLTKEEFLKKFDANQITLNLTPIWNLPPNYIKDFLARTKTHYANFKDQMFYMGIVDSNKYRYHIYYEWTDRGCVWGVSDMSLYKEISDQKAWAQANEDYNSWSKIDNSYCEKLLGITIPSSKGLSKIK